MLTDRRRKLQQTLNTVPVEAGPRERATDIPPHLVKVPLTACGV